MLSSVSSEGNNGARDVVAGWEGERARKVVASRGSGGLKGEAEDDAAPTSTSGGEG